MANERFTLRAAVYLILIKDGSALLSRRYNTGWMDGKYSLIAGHLDGKEKVSDSMIREAFEEAGIKVAKEDLKPVKVLHRNSGDQEYMDFFFLAEKWEGEPQVKEPDKCDDMSWFPIDSLPENTLPYIKNVIENYKDGVPFIESDWD
ncbi:MAG: NUDIX hydrolase [Microgenomates group bacterium GW2011_GWC1_43_13]|uniref:NUDIX hydrolase n=3 Tax=Candidatus Woeseibacteriota TaxID=1752722 RepID=A0A837IL35_9BACT|nr:MAG: NUDIX hydrolase [Microgenomates group bacterium GW2011_GWC1_43_13]KKT33554.1 MAG: NUDIX hydrolase [Candidatus Woesebacteria bacterium GW2011_GWB1_44_11]KKT55043.1 MAG: NUDIX hydrolase [Candidatus Woesebacteria bacterium GW2011_GWA1_44_23]OGM76847.1 MAG: NUDIX hydrolase [Candidatus Woesebacteria bacterium RIFOXYA1_FULL_43_16]OGM83242.1 MAG: NUDIX hydrolase [Candidatus Woesebacteria bacterium RIFOXYB1_FULL_42_36]OGM85042.1 MAG: NUDIX hydrolase [Candidatus Woesebacteria bacterium RIFOXYC1